MAAARQPLTPALAFRLMIADGKPGADQRIADQWRCSRQWVNLQFNKHKRTLRDIPIAGRSAPLPSAENVPDVDVDFIPIVAENGRESVTDPFLYEDPPNAYPKPEPRIDDCANLRDMAHVTFHEPVFDMPQTDLLADLIMSNELHATVAAEPILQVPEFAYSIRAPVIYLQVADAKPRRQLRPGEMHLILCACMTIITIAAGTQALGLGMALWIVMMVMWATPV